MRLGAKKPIKLKTKFLGGSLPLVCIPIVAENEEELKITARKVVELCPDVIEWRADFFEDIYDIQKVAIVLKELKSIIKEIPLIFTFRSSLEGGHRKIDDSKRYSILKEAIGTGEIDAVDIELISGKDIQEIKGETDKHNISLIISYHNFIETPSAEFLADKMKQQVLQGADIIKIAVMANAEEDVLKLFSATLKARREMPDIPLITMSMGEIGMISRIAGGIFGSDLTFGSVEKTSAPGQIPFGKLRVILENIFSGTN